MHKAVIFDIDGTLADSKHRLKYIEQQPKQWDKFFSESIKDKYIPAVYNEYKKYKKAGHKIIILTGRPETQRALTEEWLYKKDIQYNELYMCHNKLTNKPQHEVKEALILSLILQYKIYAAYDDNEYMQDIYKKLNIKFYYIQDKQIKE